MHPCPPSVRPLPLVARCRSSSRSSTIVLFSTRRSSIVDQIKSNLRIHGMVPVDGDTSVATHAHASDKYYPTAQSPQLQFLPSLSSLWSPFLPASLIAYRLFTTATALDPRVAATAEPATKINTNDPHRRARKDDDQGNGASCRQKYNIIIVASTSFVKCRICKLST